MVRSSSCHEHSPFYASLGFMVHLRMHTILLPRSALGWTEREGDPNAGSAVPSSGIKK